MRFLIGRGGPIKLDTLNESEEGPSELKLNLKAARGQVQSKPMTSSIENEKAVGQQRTSCGVFAIFRLVIR
jgi:hypothetical protein